MIAVHPGRISKWILPFKNTIENFETFVPSWDQTYEPGTGLPSISIIVVCLPRHRCCFAFPDLISNPQISYAQDHEGLTIIIASISKSRSTLRSTNSRSLKSQNLVLNLYLLYYVAATHDDESYPTYAIPSNSLAQ